MDGVRVMKRNAFAAPYARTRPEEYEGDPTQCARARSLGLDLERISLINAINFYREELEEDRITDIVKSVRFNFLKYGIIKNGIKKNKSHWAYRVTSYGKRMLKEAAR
ncbi:unnamed protein product [marine sediment metagenome]|uniref:Uncharacterized protein n=1 Tax=marine sediment metagenome TaxID=412755 RepID=X1F5R7_9ZZZZ